jgi:uncharacterized iron-regulated membrane protein
VTLRQLWRRLHLWIGLAAGLIFVLLGLTGSILVYQDEILDLLYPDIMRVAIGDRMAPPSHLAAAARSLATGRVNTLRYPEAADRALQVVMVQPGGRRTTVLVDPYTAAPIGPLPGAAFPVITELHGRLLLATAGRDLVGWFGVAFAISAITGVILWWPRNWRVPRQWRQTMSLQWRRASWFRRSFDLHKVGGAVIALPLLLLSISGSAISFREALMPVMTAFGGLQQTRAAAMANAAPAGPVVSLDDLAAEALRLMPGARLVFVLPPARPGGTTRIRLREPSEIHQNGRSYVLFDADGRILDIQRVSQLPAANLVFDQLPYPLHTGYLFGEAGRLIVFIAGLLPALLFVTGIVMWLKRRPTRPR